MTIAAVGPCCANGRLNVIDDELKAPRMKEIRAVLQTRLSEHIILRLGGTDRRQYNLPQLVNLANVPANYHVDARRGHGARSAGQDVDDQLAADLEPPAGQLQHRFLPPAERRPQLGARPWHGPGARAAVRRAVGDDDRRHRAQVRRHRREPRLPRQRERPGGHRRNLQRRQRPDELARAACSSSAATWSSGRRCISCRTAFAAAPWRATRTASTSAAWSSPATSIRASSSCRRCRAA